MGRGWDEVLAHVFWWLLHAAGLVAALALPTDLRIGTASQLAARHWVVALTLAANVILYYIVRCSDPGYLPAQPSATPGCEGGCEALSPLLQPPGTGLTISTPTAAATSSASWPHTATTAAGFSAAAGAAAASKAGAASASLAVNVCSQCGAARRQGGFGATHCRYCDRCVEGFDHHCWWLGVCVGARNHHLFVRYTVSQTFVCLLGSHYALTACGRRGAGGRSWAYSLLLVMIILTILLSCLASMHTVLVLTGQSGRQVLRRVRDAGPWGAGGAAAGAGAGIAGALLGATVTSHGSGGGQGGGRGTSLGKAMLQPHRLSAGVLLQNACWLVCGVRPTWLVTSGWMQRLSACLYMAVNNDVYSCC